jgi:hypothetical protein
VTISHDPPAAGRRGDDAPPPVRLTIDRESWREEPPTVELEVRPEWRDAQVSVRSVIDLGFEVFYGEPIRLGSLRPPDQ